MENTKPKSSFLDPVANAKVLGFIIIILSFINILGDIPGLMKNVIADSTTLNLLIHIGSFITGFGLYAKKKWGLYIFLGVQGIKVFLDVLYTITGHLVSGWLLNLIIVTLLFIWLFQARNRFE